MKVAIVTGHYTSELGYQEVFLARAYARLGYRVRVFTSTSVSPNSEGVVDGKYSAGLDTESETGVEVLRLPVLISFGANVVCRDLAKSMRAYAPDAIVIIAVAKLFPWPLLNAEFGNDSRVVTVFGDSLEYDVRGGILGEFRHWMRRLLFVVAKKPLYEKSVQFSERVVLNHAETKEVMVQTLSTASLDLLQRKQMDNSLGFDPEEFFFDLESRSACRREIGCSNEDVVLVTSTRVNRHKGLEPVIRKVSTLREAGVAVHYVLIGLLGDEYEDELRAMIDELGHPEAFSMYPFLDRQTIRRMFCAADVGIWMKAAISIQQAMGTGLEVLLEDKAIVRHLVEDGVNGWLYPSGRLDEGIEKAVSDVAARTEERRVLRRREVADRNALRLSYDSIAASLIADAQAGS